MDLDSDQIVARVIEILSGNSFSKEEVELHMGDIDYYDDENNWFKEFAEWDIENFSVTGKRP